MKPVFAVDVGGVLASKQHDGEPVKGAMAALSELQDSFDLQIVSMCGRNRALKTREWLVLNGFDRYFSKQTYIGFDEKNKNRVLRQIEAQ